MEVYQDRTTPADEFPEEDSEEVLSDEEEPAEVFSEEVPEDVPVSVEDVLSEDPASEAVSDEEEAGEETPEEGEDDSGVLTCVDSETRVRNSKLYASVPLVHFTV